MLCAAPPSALWRMLFKRTSFVKVWFVARKLASSSRCTAARPEARRGGANDRVVDSETRMQVHVHAHTLSLGSLDDLGHRRLLGLVGV